MPVNFPLIQTELQRRADLVDSSTSVNDILQLLDQINSSTDGKKFEYDSDSLLPLGDSAYEGMVVLSNGAFKVYNAIYDNWDTLDSSSFPEPTPPPHYQGSVSGYISGGTPSLGRTDIIEKFPFSTDTNSTDVGDLTVERRRVAGQSSSDNGYTSGGDNAGHLNVIDKFPFSVDANATDVGDLTVSRASAAGQSSDVSGYTSGASSGGPTNIYLDVIDKFPFAADANATDVGDLTVTRGFGAGQQSTDNGYTSGGSFFPPSTWYNTIDKFPFAADANATDVGDLTVARSQAAGQSSDVSGYTSGGSPGSADIIEKFPFAADANATDVGDLNVARYRVAGQSSLSNGYTSGGQPGPTADIIDKFPFAADTNATYVGDLTSVRYSAAGQQV